MTFHPAGEGAPPSTTRPSAPPAAASEPQPVGRWDAVIAGLPRPPKQTRAKKTAAARLDAAEHAIAERRIERFTTADVARIAGVSIGTVYGYFTDRVAILDALYPARHTTAATLTEISQLLHMFNARNRNHLSPADTDLLDQLMQLADAHLSPVVK